MNKTASIRVMIVDDHAVVRRGLRTFLLIYADLELVAEAEDGAEAIALCKETQPDVILMDLVMPGMDGAAAAKAIRQAHPNIQVLALTSYKDKDRVQEVLQAGAVSYLLKDVSAEELASAIRAAHAGRPTLAPEAAQALIEANHSTPGSALTARETAVLECLREGCTNQAIAKKLCFSYATIKLDLQNIYKKLGVKSRTEAIAEAIKQDIIR